MIQSMTGFGKTTVEFPNKKVTVEIKSLNSKQLDLSMKVAYQYREREMQLRSLIQSALQRGKVDFNISVEMKAAQDAPRVNTEVIKEYKSQIDDLRKELGLPPLGFSVESSALLMQSLLRMPDAIVVQAQSIETEELDSIVKAAQEAIEKLTDFRKQEGESLYRMFTEKINTIRELLAQVEPFEKMRTEKIRQNILDRFEQLAIDYDRNRLEQEMIYYIEKLDINEEKIRLKNHLDYFIETMDSPMDAGGHGKKLGFIAQEMGREINTLGSKSNQAEMQRIVVMMKDQLEQIKEQVLNVM